MPYYPSLEFATPSDVGTANAEGTAETIARSDHVHKLPFTPVQTALGVASGAVSFNTQNLTSVGTVNGWRNHGSSATDPVSPAPVAGDRYYNTVMGEEMIYDGVRTKWLSVASLTFMSGATGGTATGSYFRGMDGLAYGTNIGHPVPKGTLTGLAVTRTNTAIATLDVYVGGAVIASLALPGSAGLTVNWLVNADFAQGIMQFRNQAGGGTITNAQITAIMKRRI